MMRKYKLCFLGILIFIGISISGLGIQHHISKNKNINSAGEPKQQENNIPIEEKIGQMLILGYTNNTAFNDILTALSQNKLSGIILYGRNIQDKQSSIIQQKKIYNASKSYVPFIMIDQEGGQVSRIAAKNGFKTYPTAEDISKASLKETYEVYYDMAKNLREIGINFNLAPCLDIKTNNNSSLAKTKRLYGNNPETVEKYSTAFIKAHQANNVGVAIKHFPGLGSSATDAHYTNLDITENWQEAELVPFIRITSQFPDVSVMVAHVKNKKLDPDKISSASLKTISLLKNSNGLIISDAMDMIILSNEEMENQIIDSINAGVDIFIFPNHIYSAQKYTQYITADQFISIVQKAIKDGKIKQDRIDNAYKKITEYKKNLLGGTNWETGK